MDTNPDDPWKRHALQFSAGIGSPVGFVGSVYSTPSFGRLGLQAGVGMGWSGMMLSAMPKLTLFNVKTCRLGFGVGGGMGIGAFSKEKEPGPVSAWLDVDLFTLECRSASRNVSSFGFGFTRRLSKNIPSDDDGYPDFGNGGPQIHLGFGRTF